MLNFLQKILDLYLDILKFTIKNGEPYTQVVPNILSLVVTELSGFLNLNYLTFSKIKLQFIMLAYLFMFSSDVWLMASILTAQI